MQKMKLRQYGIFAVVFVLMLGLFFGLFAMTDRKQASAASEDVPRLNLDREYAQFTGLTTLFVSKGFSFDPENTSRAISIYWNLPLLAETEYTFCLPDDVFLYSLEDFEFGALNSNDIEILSSDSESFHFVYRGSSRLTRIGFCATVVVSYDLYEGFYLLGELGSFTPSVDDLVNFDPEMEVTDNITIVAKYEDAVYPITFSMLNADGTKHNKFVTATHGHKLSEYIPTTTIAPTGKHLTGWDKSDTTTVTGAMTITATYELNTYTITFAMLNADGSVNNTTATATHGHDLSEYIPTSGITAPTGKNHTGWDKVGTTVVTGAMTINATYAWNTYTITLKSLNAEGQEQTSTVTATYGHQLSEYVPTSGITAPTGKHFTGWHVDVAMVVTGAMEIDASYAWNTYTITFAMLNADGSVNNTTVTATHGHKLSEYIPASGMTAPAHKHLTGWDKAGITEVTGAMTVTAVYAWDQFTVTFRYLDKNGKDM